MATNWRLTAPRGAAGKSVLNRVTFAELCKLCTRCDAGFLSTHVHRIGGFDTAPSAAGQYNHVCKFCNALGPPVCAGTSLLTSAVPKLPLRTSLAQGVILLANPSTGWRHRVGSWSLMASTSRPVGHPDRCDNAPGRPPATSVAFAPAIPPLLVAPSLLRGVHDCLLEPAPACLRSADLSVECAAQLAINAGLPIRSFVCPLASPGSR